MSTEITYTYEIINVNLPAKAMEIVYNSPVYGVLHVGARLPYADETLDDVVRMFAPITYWLEQTKTVQPVVVGTSGQRTDSIDPVTPPIAWAWKGALVESMRIEEIASGPYTGMFLWDVVKQLLSQADPVTQERWDLVSQLPRDDATLLAIGTAIYGDPAVVNVVLDRLFAKAAV